MMKQQLRRTISALVLGLVCHYSQASLSHLQADESFVRTMLSNSDAPVKRVALVIGNSSYSELSRLPNPKNDAAAVSSRLQALGFHVTLGIDLSHDELDLATREFSGRLEKADIALFYYAGHGIQIDDKNYIVAVDASVERGNAHGFYAMDNIMGDMREHVDISLVLLDACRDNGLAAMGIENIEGTPARNLGRGLNVVELPKTEKTTSAGMFIAFATSPNRTASDGVGEHSPFTESFLKHAGEPGLSIGHMMSRVSNSVGELTHWQQTPWTRSSLTSEIYLNGHMQEEQLESISANKADQATKLLHSGDRKKAIETALLGLPARIDQENETLFQESLVALRQSLLSSVHFIDTPSPAINTRISIDPWLFAFSDDQAIHVEKGDGSESVFGLPGSFDFYDWDLSAEGTLATLSESGVISIYSGKDFSKKRSWKGFEEDKGFAVRLSEDGSLVVATAGDTMAVWEVASGNLIGGFQSNAPPKEAQDGPTFEEMKANPAAMIQLKNSDPDKFNAMLTAAAHASVSGRRELLGRIEISPNGSLIAIETIPVGNTDGTRSNPTLYIWDAHEQRLRYMLKDVGKIVTDLVFSTSETILAVSDANGAISLWDMRTGKKNQKIRVGVATLVMVDEVNDVVASVGQEGLSYYRITTGEKISASPEFVRGYHFFFAKDGRGLGSMHPRYAEFRRQLSHAEVMRQSLGQLDPEGVVNVASNRIRYWPISRSDYEIVDEALNTESNFVSAKRDWHLPAFSGIPAYSERQAPGVNKSVVANDPAGSVPKTSPEQMWASANLLVLVNQGHNLIGQGKFSEGLASIQQAAENGSIDGQIELANYHLGRTSKLPASYKDVSVGKHYLNLVNTNSDLTPRHQFGLAVLNATLEVPDPISASRHLRASAFAGDVLAQTYLVARVCNPAFLNGPGNQFKVDIPAEVSVANLGSLLDAMALTQDENALAVTAMARAGLGAQCPQMFDLEKAIPLATQFAELKKYDSFNGPSFLVALAVKLLKGDGVIQDASRGVALLKIANDRFRSTQAKQLLDQLSAMQSNPNR